jgi:hypothetical protein
MFRSSGNPLRRAGASVSEIAVSRFINHTISPASVTGGTSAKKSYDIRWKSAGESIL